MIPSVVMISTKTWNDLSDEHKAALTKAAKESMDFHRDQWDAMSAAAVETAKSELGVKFIEVEKGPFFEAVLPRHEESAKQSPVVADLIKRIKAIAP